MLDDRAVSCLCSEEQAATGRSLIGRSSSSGSETRSATGASDLTLFGSGDAPWAMAVSVRLPDDASPSGRTTTYRLPSPGRRRSAAHRGSHPRPRRARRPRRAGGGQTALFGSRFRENAGRALLIPRRRPGERDLAWQQRLKAQSLLQVARKYPAFPIVLETYRECLQDVFDLPALEAVASGAAYAAYRRR